MSVSILSRGPLTRTDTADRLRPTDLVLIDKDLAEQHPDRAGKWMLVDEIADAGMGRLALTLVDEHGRVFFDDGALTAFIYAGDTCTYRAHNPGMADATGIRPGGTQ